tara:strand:+ start:37 stop:1038 length:1002 start_codon:yes stop_codon:yes gene_type:complete
MSKGKQTTTQEATLPDWQKDLYMDYYQRAQEAADIPFQGYTGDRIAGLSPEELQMGAGIQGLFGTAFGFDPTSQLQQLAGQQAPQIGDVPSLLDMDISAYQSPYQQQVIDLTEQDFARRRDLQRQQAEDVAMRSGAFGGSRGTIYEQEALRPLQEQEARTVAGLRQAGFEQAQRAAEADVARQQQLAMLAPELELRGRQQQAGLLGGLLGGQQQALGLLGGYGGLSRGIGQAQRDFDFSEFMRQQQYPAYQLGLLGQGLGMMPQLVGQTSTTQSTAGPMGVLGGLAGLGSSLALGGINPFGGLGGLFSSGKPGQSVAKQLGYDLSDPESLFGI